MRGTPVFSHANFAVLSHEERTLAAQQPSELLLEKSQPRIMVVIPLSTPSTREPPFTSLAQLKSVTANSQHPTTAPFLRVSLDSERRAHASQLVTRRLTDPSSTISRISHSTAQYFVGADFASGGSKITIASLYERP